MSRAQTRSRPGPEASDGAGVAGAAPIPVPDEPVVVPPVLPGIGLAALGALMPMFLWLDPGGRVLAMGPTLRKLLGPAAHADAPRFGALFAVSRPASTDPAETHDTTPDLLPSTGRLRLRLARPPGTGFRAQAVRLADGGHLLNLGFGIHAEAAVRRHGLTDRDFAATDLTVELLFLQEARSAVMAELARLNARLDAARQTAEVQAQTDPLTGLRNRRAMDAALAACDQAARDGAALPFGLIHVDLDRFKQVNDTLGHAAGDAVLMAAARRIEAEVRAQDVAARIGGDEFLLLLPGLDGLAVLGAIGTRLIARLEEPVMVDGHALQISASVGYAASTRYPPGALDRMLSDVDAALYAAKRAGRGRAVAAPGVDAVAIDTAPDQVAHAGKRAG